MQSGQQNSKKKAIMQPVLWRHFFTGKESEGVPPSQKEVINISLGDYRIGRFRQLFQPWRFRQPASNEDVLMLNAA